MKVGKAGRAISIIPGSTRSTVIVLKALNIVFTEIRPTLDLDEDQLLCSDVLDPVSRTLRHVDRIAGLEADLAAIKSHFGGSSDDHPVFRAVGVLLVAQALLRQDFDALDFVVFGLVQDGVAAPRADVIGHWRRIYLWI